MLEAVSYIHSLSLAGKKSGLSNMHRLLAALGNPQEKLYILHVAGTNGKGSTCAMLERMLRASGLRTGLYTSPFLQRYNERIRENGLPISDGELQTLVDKTRPVVERLRDEGVGVTEFEYGTALAFCHFAGRTDVCVIETGLGGRLDPTNAAPSRLALITPIGLDHTHILGDTIEAIAGEKAGIIKPNTPVVIANMRREAQAVLVARARELGCPMRVLSGEEIHPKDEGMDSQSFDFASGTLTLRDVVLALPGEHQRQNAAAALSAMDLLRADFDLPDAALREGLACVRWAGRLEWMGNVLLDGAHNPHGAKTLAAYMARWLQREKTVWLFAAMRDKDVSGVRDIIKPLCGKVVCTQVPDLPRAMPAQELQAQCGAEAIACTDMRRALECAREMAGADGTVVCAGSLYLVGAVRTMLEEEGHGV